MNCNGSTVAGGEKRYRLNDASRDGDRTLRPLPIEYASLQLSRAVLETAAHTIPSVWEATHPGLAIVRLHGRNHSTWNLKGLSSSAERFNYDYRTEELADIAEKTRELSRQAEITQVIFNNNYEDQGQRKGREMIAILAENS